MTRKKKKHEKREMHTVGTGIWQDKGKCGKWETHTVGHGKWREKPRKLNNEKCSQ